VASNISEANEEINFKVGEDGKVWAREIEIVEVVPNSDYVFEPDYNLRTLDEVERFVNENKHLPEIPSAQEFKENGYNVGKMDDLLLRKVEELTLYTIEQQRNIEKQQKTFIDQQKTIELLLEQNEELLQRIESIEGK